MASIAVSHAMDGNSLVAQKSNTTQVLKATQVSKAIAPSQANESAANVDDETVPEIVTDQIIDLPDRTYKLSVRTTASAATIWSLWEEVEGWKRYDTILQYSYLVDNAPFAKGSIGYVKAKGAPKTKFELIEVNAPFSFVESLKLPFYNTLELRRYFESDGSLNDEEGVVFTHEVAFKGPLKSIAYFFLSKTFKKELPLVMGRMRDLAEQLEQEHELEQKRAP